MTDFRKKGFGRERIIGKFAAIPDAVAIEVTAEFEHDFICVDAGDSHIGGKLGATILKIAQVARAARKAVGISFYAVERHDISRRKPRIG